MIQDREGSTVADFNKAHMNGGYAGTCMIDVAQKNWFGAVNNCLEANHAAYIQTTIRIQFTMCCKLNLKSYLLLITMYLQQLIYLKNIHVGEILQADTGSL